MALFLEPDSETDPKQTRMHVSATSVNGTSTSTIHGDDYCCYSSAPVYYKTPKVS